MSKSYKLKDGNYIDGKSIITDRKHHRTLKKEEFLVTTDANVTINYQKVKRTGNVVTITISFTPNENISMFTLLFNLPFNTTESAMMIPVCNRATYSTVWIYLLGQVIQSYSNSLDKDVNYRFSFTYIED